MADVHVNQNAYLIAARIAGRSADMDRGATRVMMNAKQVAARYIDTSAYVNNFDVVTVPGQFGTGRSVDDRLVVNNDPGAAAQEFGYIRRFKNSRRVQYVPGRHILRTAIWMSST
ncbi:DUF5403 family protein [Microbacterium sp. No. 7]|uniref:DUF5403 family protein n=1 Tax=Microbacterium sp. No. 7 TaxID=1714373 RepID=UPI0006D25241|nr:DUF5403 family protein [Microbacterium sp. No. 7]ALJ22044.1 hypothetical protein AOA12_19970 [Microbacterium sp. No. 7]